jgi:hypothetical protein
MGKEESVTFAVTMPKSDIETLQELRDREYSDLELSQEPAYQESVAVLDGLLAASEHPSSEPEVESDNRVRCWALGIRMRETADNIKRSSEELVGIRDSPFTDVRQGVLETEVKNLVDLFEKSRECGIEWNGDAGGSVANLQHVVEVISRDPSGRNRQAGAKTVEAAARDLVETLHEDTVFEIAGRGG